MFCLARFAAGCISRDESSMDKPAGFLDMIVPMYNQISLLKRKGVVSFQWGQLSAVAGKVIPVVQGRVFLGAKANRDVWGLAVHPYLCVLLCLRPLSPLLYILKLAREIHSDWL